MANQSLTLSRKASLAMRKSITNNEDYKTMLGSIINDDNIQDGVNNYTLATAYTVNEFISLGDTLKGIVDNIKNDYTTREEAKRIAKEQSIIFGG